MIDLHSHILPKIDDGSKSIEMTLEMLETAENDGTINIVATPHYYRGYWTPLYDDVKKQVEELNVLIAENGMNIKVYPGHEVFFNENIIEDYQKGNIGTINNSRYMLIEFPMNKIDDNVFDVLYELQIRGVVPIIAHPERYMDFINNPSSINKFIEEGYLFQLNGYSITGLFGKEAKKTAEILLKNNIYSFIGSDAHGVGKRNTSLSNVCKVIEEINKGSIRKFIDNGEKVINNDVIEFSGKKVEKKRGLFSFFKR